MIMPQLPGSSSYLQPGTPSLAVFPRVLSYTTGEIGKNHPGDHPDTLPIAHGFERSNITSMWACCSTSWTSWNRGQHHCNLHHRQ